MIFLQERSHNVAPLSLGFVSYIGSSGAPGNMIMDGLETLVAPTHHAFLLTESAAAAHFNVLSFDSCLFKPSSTSSFVATHHHHHHHHPQLQHLNLQATTHHQTTAAGTTTSSQAEASNQSSNSSSSATAQTEVAEPNRMANSLGGSGGGSVPINGPTITILDNGHGSSGGALSHLQNNNSRSSSSNSSNSGHNNKGSGNNEVEAAQGDLNTPVTTANDLPSFFGPSVVLEPPPITGKCYWQGFSMWECGNGDNEMMV